VLAEQAVVRRGLEFEFEVDLLDETLRELFGLLPV
jgi:hypothetical protein